ncbi:phytanoyl-CoA dioxygenase family protein [Mucilaginibacter yixingensis]|uniref:phytanoyl-CoA dioxygenase family protein n=1 Tax=Mucilaginibacter yixingensis TaxID=1295612 RepID=UPI000D2F558B|nr:phytanoyl-CoA dioxygenase family protein [Mucilaginibacter yixingensis]
MNISSIKNYKNVGYEVISGVFTFKEVQLMIAKLQEFSRQDNPLFRRSEDLFAIRQFLKQFPELLPVVFNDRLKRVIHDRFSDEYFIVKSIYFDKPGASNWFVAYHQDLTISVDKKSNLPGYGPWTVKHEQFAVQPPLAILQDNFTVRIHLDDTDEQNGALKVIPGSHLKGIYRPETIDWTTEQEVSCNVPAGGIMLMSPLLLHASGRTTNQQQRRVLHIEFSRSELAGGLSWAEKVNC